MGKSDLEILKRAAEAEKFEPTPRYRLTSEGVEYIGIKYDRNTGNVSELPPIRLCDRLELVGRGEDESGQQYRLLSWRSRGSSKMNLEIFPLRLAGEREGWAILRGSGLAIMQSRNAQERLAEYIQTQGCDEMHHITASGGWQHGGYVLPTGDVLGEVDKPVIYNGDSSSVSAYSVSGDAESWKRSVAHLAAGNSRCLLALGCSFAAPLLDLVQLESGGIHLYGDSSGGKTTCALIAASVYGPPELQTLNWDSTPLALANSAAARNDGLMILDEVGQGSADAVSLAAYRLFNGTGKAQGARDGGNRQTPRYRVLVFSTGEHALGQFLSSAGRTVKAGQDIRLVSIPADAGAGYGAFEYLHDYKRPGQLAEAIKEATNAHHGAVGRTYIDYVARHRDAISARLNNAIVEWRNSLPPEAAGQARRVISRFAAMSFSLELATELGLTGWTTGTGPKAMRRIFNEWLAENGCGRHEDSAILRQARLFLDLHGQSRFSEMSSSTHSKMPENKAGHFSALPASSTPATVASQAGFRRYNQSGEPEFLLFPSVFDEEVIKGFSRKKACQVLAKAGMLKPGSEPPERGIKARTSRHPSGGRYFVMVARDIEPTSFPGEMDDC